MSVIINLCLQCVAKLMCSELLGNAGWSSMSLVVSCGHSWASLYSLKMHQSWSSWMKWACLGGLPKENFSELETDKWYHQFRNCLQSTYLPYSLCLNVFLKLINSCNKYVLCTCCVLDTMLGQNVVANEIYMGFCFVALTGLYISSRLQRLE